MKPMSRNWAQYAHDEAIAKAAAEKRIQLEQDSARLAYLYSGKDTTSDALIKLELRMINDDIPTMGEVREAIDAAMAATQPSTKEE
jgi:hypothetical protein